MQNFIRNALIGFVLLLGLHSCENDQKMVVDRELNDDDGILLNFQVRLDRKAKFFETYKRLLDGKILNYGRALVRLTVLPTNFSVGTEYSEKFISNQETGLNVTLKNDYKHPEPESLSESCFNSENISALVDLIDIEPHDEKTNRSEFTVGANSNFIPHPENLNKSVIINCIGYTSVYLNGKDVADMAVTILHEIGHNLGMEHNKSNVISGNQIMDAVTMNSDTDALYSGDLSALMSVETLKNTNFNKEDLEDVAEQAKAIYRHNRKTMLLSGLYEPDSEFSESELNYLLKMVNESYDYVSSTVKSDKANLTVRIGVMVAIVLISFLLPLIMN